MGALSKEGKHPSTSPPTYQNIKVTNANHMSMMKTNLTTIPMCPREHFVLYKSSSRLVLCYKKDWATLLHLVTLFTCYPFWFILSQNYLLPIILVLAENTLLKTACHFLLLLVGFDTLTYRKDYDRSPILVCRCVTTPMGSQESLLRLLGRRVARRAGLVDSTRIVYPGSGHKDA